MIRHLQTQLKKAVLESEQVAELRQREAELTGRVGELTEKLRESKLHQTPVSCSVFSSPSRKLPFEVLDWLLL